MLIINRTPKEVRISLTEAGQFEFVDTLACVENGDKAFQLIVEDDSGNPGRIFFSNMASALEFTMNN